MSTTYPADPGLIRAFDPSGRPNLGRSLETAVFNELERRGAQVSYVKDEEGRETDFLARYPAGKEELLQVCADLSDPSTFARETAGLSSAARRHRRRRA